MSPEQIRGERLDPRTDLFSFGVVLYEMATAKLPFEGETQGSAFDSILNHTPASLRELNPGLPVELERIMSKCLGKDREARYQHASEILADLQQLKQDTDSARIVPDARRKARVSKRWGTALAAAIAIAVGTRNPEQKRREFMTAVASKGSLGILKVASPGISRALD